MKLVIIAKIRETLTCSSSPLAASVVSLSAFLLHRLNFHLDLIQTAAIYLPSCVTPTHIIFSLSVFLLHWLNFHTIITVLLLLVLLL